MRGAPPIAPYKHIVQIGDPVLRQTAKDVDPTKLNDSFVQQVSKKCIRSLTLSKISGCFEVK